MLILMTTLSLLAPLAQAEIIVDAGAGNPTDTACNSHTDGDAKTCNARCYRNRYVGVTMTLDDSREQGHATTTCGASTAYCELPGGTAQCGSKAADESSSYTDSPWSCHFEAHDVWYRPDSGFSYNCYASTTAGTYRPAMATPRCVVQTDWLQAEVDLCRAVASGDAPLVPDVDTQVVVRGGLGGLAALQCGTHACVPIPVDCARELGRISCDVSPRAT